MELKKDNRMKLTFTQSGEFKVEAAHTHECYVCFGYMINVYLNLSL